MPKISYRMRDELSSIANTTLNGVPGQKTFYSGFPTYDALVKRGLVTIKGNPERRTQWIVELTDLGWQYLGKTRPLPTAEEV